MSGFLLCFQLALFPPTAVPSQAHKAKRGSHITQMAGQEAGTTLAVPLVAQVEQCGVGIEE